MKQADTWELRHKQKAGVSSTIPYCGYTPEQLKQLRKQGYRLYCNGKVVPTRL